MGPLMIGELVFVQFDRKHLTYMEDNTPDGIYPVTSVGSDSLFDNTCVLNKYCIYNSAWVKSVSRVCMEELL